MADSDYSVIKPVESLPSIQGLEPAKRRQERKRHQKSPGQHREEPETESEETSETEAQYNDDDPHSIDYCA